MVGSVIIGVFVGGALQIFHNGKEHSTGIFKSRTEKNIKVSELGIESDV
ncbi:MAG: DNA polymerase/3'-5' exonuclease PolX [Pseudohongiellaceae bacterium]|jgi:DNA polymerase/3'-5' exonuclease PolX